MKRKLLFTVAIAMATVFSMNTAHAQLDMEKGTVNLSARLGTGFLQINKFNTVNGDATDVKYDDFKANGLAFGGGFELAILDNIAIGCDINYAKYKNDAKGVTPTGTGFHSYGEMSILAFIFHAKYFTPIKISKLTTYVRADVLPFGVFKKNRTTDWTTGVQSFSNKSGVKMTYGIYGGADLELTKNIGAFAELGYGYTAANIGARFTISH